MAFLSITIINNFFFLFLLIQTIYKKKDKPIIITTLRRDSVLFCNNTGRKRQPSLPTCIKRFHDDKKPLLRTTPGELSRGGRRRQINKI